MKTKIFYRNKLYLYRWGKVMLDFLKEDLIDDLIKSNNKNELAIKQAYN